MFALTFIVVRKYGIGKAHKERSTPATHRISSPNFYFAAIHTTHRRERAIAYTNAKRPIRSVVRLRADAIMRTWGVV